MAEASDGFNIGPNSVVLNASHDVTANSPAIPAQAANRSNQTSNSLSKSNTNATTTTTTAAPVPLNTTTPKTAIVGQNGSSNGTSPDKDEKCLSERFKKCVIGIIIAIMTCVSWMSMSQLSNYALKTIEFDAPFLIVFITTALLVAYYPLYILVRMACIRRQKSLRDQILHDIGIFGSSGSIKDRLLRALLLCILFTFIWDLTYYLHARTLEALAVANVLAMFGCFPCFIYLLTWIVLHDDFIALRVVASIFTLSGAVVMTYKDGIGDSTKMWWFILTIFTPAGAAIFKVVSRRMIGDTTCGQTALFLSVIGLFHLLTMWLLYLILTLTNAEQIIWASWPWQYVIAAIFSGTIFQFLMNFGPLVTYDAFLEFGIMLAIPITAGYDVMFQKLKFSTSNIIADCLIMFGYLLLLLPSDWDDKLLSTLHVRRKIPPQIKERVASPRNRLRGNAAA